MTQRTALQELSSKEARVRTIKPNQVSTPDSYRFYMAGCDNPVSKSIYLAIINEFFKYIFQLILSGQLIKLNNNMGCFSVIGRKQKLRVQDGKIIGAAPDWKATNELWARDEEAKANKKLVYHLNEATNGVHYTIKWHKSGAKHENIAFYDMRMSRSNNRELGRMITEENKEYIVV